MNSDEDSKTMKVLWTLFLVTLGIALAWGVFALFENIDFSKILRGGNNNSLANISQAGVINETSKENEDKPAYFYLNKNADTDPESNLRISARSYLVGDLATGEVIISKNQEESLSIASISKLMTALVTSEIMTDGKTPETTKKTTRKTTTISKQAIATYGTNGRLRIGETIRVSDLLYPLLLESSNDAAEALAEHFGREEFLAKMNLKAETLLMSGTSYADPSGLSADNKSTASDIFKLSGYLTQSGQDLLGITRQRSQSEDLPESQSEGLQENKSGNKRSWFNINPLHREVGYLGGKTGYTDAAGQTVVSMFSLPLGEHEERPIAIVLLASKDRLRDTKNILDFLDKNIYYGGEADESTDWVRQKVGLPSIKDPNFITLSLAGDLMLDRGVRSSVVRNFNNDYSALFENLGLLKDSDIVFANLEGTASDQGRDLGNLYSFRMNPAVVPALSGAGINILSVANNHIGDWGRDAYTDTLDRLRENEILYTGGGINKAAAEQPAIIEKYGMKIGFLGFSDLGPRSMEAKEKQAGILMASDPRFGEIIENASRQVDYLVVSFHFGDEYKPIHNQRQETLAHRAIDNGAKIVIGHHPHVIQDTEIYGSGFIAYSVGNFIFDQSWSKPTMEGMLLNIKLMRGGNMTVREDKFKLNSAFQPGKIIKGKEQKLEF